MPVILPVRADVLKKTLLVSQGQPLPDAGSFRPKAVDHRAPVASGVLFQSDAGSNPADQIAKAGLRGRRVGKTRGLQGNMLLRHEAPA
ncbi:hypothetical protein D3C87_1301620 [compost metagenome]